jgi:hypothetical protein
VEQLGLVELRTGTTSFKCNFVIYGKYMGLWIRVHLWAGARTLILLGH